ncbi:MAG: hypothetical protein DWG76_06460 [Chloroflexi bacterium]|nr:hypothetical protein [Chloroflexota bacterium]MQC27071.1 hypothetical protein [Chloroflexota bacterium]
MKINRFFALAAIALLVVLAMGKVTSVSLAAPQMGQSQQAAACNVEDDDSLESASEVDMDDVQEECGPQDVAGDAAEGCDVEDDDSQESASSSAPDTDTDETEEQCGSQAEGLD